MAEKEMTYKEIFIEFRNKYGIYIQISCLLLMLFLLFYTFYKIGEVKEDPCSLCKRLGFTCGLTEKETGCILLEDCEGYETREECIIDDCNLGKRGVCIGFKEHNKTGEVYTKTDCGCHWDERNQTCYYMFEWKPTNVKW